MHLLCERIQRTPFHTHSDLDHWVLIQMPPISVTTVVLAVCTAFAPSVSPGPAPSRLQARLQDALSSNVAGNVQPPPLGLPQELRAWYDDYFRGRPPPPSVRPRCPTSEQAEYTQDEQQLGGTSGPSSTKSSPGGGCNMVFIKVPKCASSTAAGVARRIADHHLVQGVHEVGYIPPYSDTNKALWAEMQARVGGGPQVWACHARMNQMNVELFGLPHPTFLWSMVRSPATRAMSHYYYFIHNTTGHFGSEADKLIYLNGNELGKFEIDYLRTPMDKVVNRNGGLTQLQPNFAVQGEVEGVIVKVFEEYDFIGVSERFDESMVVLASLLNVPLSDVLYLPTKNLTGSGNGTASIGVKKMTNGVNTAARVHNPLASEPAAVQARLAEAASPSSPDGQLWVYASKQLDKFMAVPGMHTRLKDYQALLAKVFVECQSAKQRNISPSNCYFARDAVGCGHKCLDRVAKGLHPLP